MVRVLVAGGTGALGRALLPVLVAAGHEVTATTRYPWRAGPIDAAGARAVLCDALDPGSVARAMASAEPEVVVHQLTALPDRYAKLRRGSEATNRLRCEGTRILVDAAVQAGARRVVAESIAFLYAPGDGLADEAAPVWTDAPDPYGAMIAALVSLENTVTGAPGIEGVVLRYGTLYGPRTWFGADGDLTRRLRRRQFPVVGSGEGVTSFLHVDDAASAAARALDADAPAGIYNVADDDPVRWRELLPALADLLDAKPPLSVPTWLARPVAGAIGIAVMTQQRGATSAKAKRDLGWQPRYTTWRQGFAADLEEKSWSR